MTFVMEQFVYHIGVKSPKVISSYKASERIIDRNVTQVSEENNRNRSHNVTVGGLRKE